MVLLPQLPTRLPVITPGDPQTVQAFWNTDASDALGRRLGQILDASPHLREPTYAPTPWARSSKANFLLATARSRLGALRRTVEPPLTGRFSATAHPDVIVEWSKDPLGAALPPEAPIVAFLHTITGTAGQTRWLMKYASSRGWRSCVFVRRGHAKARLATPSFNLLGDVGDVELQLAAVRDAYPHAGFLGMVGVSAGSAQLISYLGRAGPATPVGAACAICPAWDVPTAFARMGEGEPLAERAMVRQVQKTFVRRNERVLRAWDADAVDACLAADDLPGLLAAHAPFAMRRRGASADEYLASHDPMAVRANVSVPTLLLNAEDDFVCPVDLARPDVVCSELPGTLLLITKEGSHVAFNEGRLGRKSFHARVSFDFLEAARETGEEEVAPAMVPSPKGVWVKPGRRVVV